MTESNTRIERDTMGEVQVPAEALYGAQTARARDNFPISGRGIPSSMIRALGMLKGAAARVNAQMSGLDPQIAKAIDRAAGEVVAGGLDGEFVVDVFQTGSGTSSNMNSNEVIAHRASTILGNEVHPNDHVNMGQSSNDIFPSSVHLAMVSGLREQLLPELKALADCFHGLADQTFDKVKTGRTHLMDAMPIRYGQVFRGYAHQVEKATERLLLAEDGLCALPLGGTAVGTGVNATPGFAAAVCEVIATTHGLPVRETDAHFQAQSSLDAVVFASGTLKSFASALYKIANDVRWMASGPLCGLGEARIPAVQPGSSIMPAKVNPVICESVLMLCGQVFANDVAVTFGNSQGQFELNTMLPFMGRNACESVEILANGCRMFRERCLEGLEITDVAEANLERNPILVTALNAEIGYEAAATIAKAAAATGRTVKDIAKEQTSLDDATLDRLLDPATLCGEDGKTRNAP